MESRHCILKEKNYAMRERILELEDIIARGLESVNQMPQEPSGTSTNQTVEGCVLDTDELQTLTAALVSTKAELLKMQRRCDALEERDIHVRGMISKFGENEAKIINHAATHISRIKEELQMLHVKQMREMSASYELEKAAMMEELTRLTRIVGVGLDSSRTIDHFVEHADGGDSEADQMSRMSRLDNSFALEARAPSHRRHSANRSRSSSSGGASLSEGSSDRGIDGDRRHQMPASAHAKPKEVVVGDNDFERRLRSEDTHDDVSALQQELALCTNRLKQAQSQVSELEQLLETQRSAFRRHLDMERDVLISSSMVGSASSTTSQSHEAGISVAIQADVNTAGDEIVMAWPRREPVRLVDTANAAVQCSHDMDDIHALSSFEQV
jgi:hypothetical protein